MYRIRVMISGDVQGVFFRISAQDKANELGLTGWVKNIFTNAVEILCEVKEMNYPYLLVGFMRVLQMQLLIRSALNGRSNPTKNSHPLRFIDEGRTLPDKYDLRQF